MAMHTIVSMKQELVELIEKINNFENEIVKGTLLMSWDQAEEKAIRILNLIEEIETKILDKESLFYVRLLQAKGEEVLDIIELKRAI